MINLQDKSQEDLQKIIAEAQAALVARTNSKRKEVIAQIKGLAASIGVSIEIHETGKKADKRASSVSAKYRNPENHSEVWTGRGLAPKWMKALMDSGRNKDEFLINS
jgi:DNA-binding protein H-NS